MNLPPRDRNRARTQLEYIEKNVKDSFRGLSPRGYNKFTRSIEAKLLYEIFRGSVDVICELVENATGEKLSQKDEEDYRFWLLEEFSKTSYRLSLEAVLKFPPWRKA